MSASLELIGMQDTNKEEKKAEGLEVSKKEMISEIQMTLIDRHKEKENLKEEKIDIIIIMVGRDIKETEEIVISMMMGSIQNPTKEEITTKKIQMMIIDWI